jgi:signal transduction histidine kinase
MDRITIFMQNKENSRLLTEWLSGKYNIVVADIRQPLDGAFDLGILDGPALQKLWDEVQIRKRAEEPTFLPFLLITSRRSVRLAARSLWRTVDELILTPIEKTELQARLEILLRARRLSMGLKQRNEDLEALAQAITHDFRAYLRIILGFARALYEDQANKLEKQALHYLGRIQGEGEAAQELVDTLLDFLRLGHEGVRSQSTQLQSVVELCLRDLEDAIEAQDAHVSIAGELPGVEGDPTLLRMVLQNLLSNALEYVAVGVKPRITVSGVVLDRTCRIQIRDNGIGIAVENHERIFQPFVRLHGVEEYPGTGLGLSSVRKAVELMGGRIGVESELGKGSIFWVELPRKSDEVSDH